MFVYADTIMPRHCVLIGTRQYPQRSPSAATCPVQFTESPRRTLHRTVHGSERVRWNMETDVPWDSFDASKALR